MQGERCVRIQESANHRPNRKPVLRYREIGNSTGRMTICNVTNIFNIIQLLWLMYMADGLYFDCKSWQYFEYKYLDIIQYTFSSILSIKIRIQNILYEQIKITCLALQPI